MCERRVGIGLRGDVPDQDHETIPARCNACGAVAARWPICPSSNNLGIPHAQGAADSLVPVRVEVIDGCELACVAHARAHHIVNVLRVSCAVHLDDR
eukprot:scaffold112375_cov69-Phaeocystis_antarctica.AAC.9